MVKLSCFLFVVTIISAVRIIIKQNTTAMETLCLIFQLEGATLYNPIANNRVSIAVAVSVVWEIISV